MLWGLWIQKDLYLSTSLLTLENRGFLVASKNFTNYFNKRVDFIIKLDKPFLSFNFNSLQLYHKLLSKGLEAGRPDLLKKGESLLKKYLFVDIDKFLLQYENDQKMMNKI